MLEEAIVDVFYMEHRESPLRCLPVVIGDDGASSGRCILHLQVVIANGEPALLVLLFVG